MATSNGIEPWASTHAGYPLYTNTTPHKPLPCQVPESDLRHYLNKGGSSNQDQGYPRRSPLLPTPTAPNSQQSGPPIAAMDSLSTDDENQNDMARWRSKVIPPTSWGRNYMVLVRRADQPPVSIHCVAIVDCQSCSSYVSEELVHLLRVPSSPYAYWVEAIGGSTHMPKGRVIENLQVCRAGTRDWFDLPPVLTTPSIPNTTTDMATKAVVESFPHIAPYAHNFPDKIEKTAPVWLLLGRNCNTAMTTQTFGDISPQVHYGRLGWAIVGSEESPKFKYHELEPQPPFIPRYVERSNDEPYSESPASSEQRFPQHSGHFQAAASTVQSQAAEVPAHTSALPESTHNLPVDHWEYTQHSGHFQAAASTVQSQAAEVPAHTSTHPEFTHNFSVDQWEHTQDPGHLQAAPSFLAAEVVTRGPTNSTFNQHPDITPHTYASSQYNPSSNIKPPRKTHRAGVKHRKYNLKRRALASVLAPHNDADDLGGGLTHFHSANTDVSDRPALIDSRPRLPEEPPQFSDANLAETMGAMALAPTIPDTTTAVPNPTSSPPPSSSVKVLIMGSSHVCKLDQFISSKSLKLHQHEVEFKFDGHSGASFKTYIERPHLLTSALKFQPHIIVVILGGNSIVKQTTDPQIRVDCHHFYQALQAAVPIHAKILGTEVFMRRLWSSPRTPTPPDFERSRDMLNNFLRTLLPADDIIELTGKTCLDSHGATYDGVHLREPALKLLWTKIVRAVSEVLMPQRKSVRFYDGS